MFAATVFIAAILMSSVESDVSCNSCNMNNAVDCTGQTCQGNYCFYERTTTQNGVSSVKRSCAFSSVFIFPDESVTHTVNQCETKTIDGITYAVEVCDSGSFCDTKCNSVSTPHPKLFIMLLPVMPFLKFR